MSMTTCILDALVFTSKLECSDEQWLRLLEACKFQVDCEIICIRISGLAFDWSSKKDHLDIKKFGCISPGQVACHHLAIAACDICCSILF